MLILHGANNLLNFLFLELLSEISKKIGFFSTGVYKQVVDLMIAQEWCHDDVKDFSLEYRNYIQISSTV